MKCKYGTIIYHMSFDQIASKESLEKTVSGLEGKGYGVEVVGSKAEALDKIKELVPSGVSVMNGASVTLEEIGYVDYLASGEHEWEDLHAKVNNEDDKEKRKKVRRESVLSDYYLGSVHALAETGEFVVASNTGSQLPHVVYTSPNLVFVVGTQKIVASLDEAMNRLKSYVVPKEDKHMQELYNVHTNLSKVVMFLDEAEMTGRSVQFVLVEEKLGF